MEKVKMDIHFRIQLNMICSKTLNYNEASMCLLPLRDSKEKREAATKILGLGGKNNTCFCSHLSYSTALLSPPFSLSQLWQFLHRVRNFILWVKCPVLKDISTWEATGWWKEGFGVKVGLNVNLSSVIRLCNLKQVTKTSLGLGNPHS